MYLSKLTLDARQPQARRDLADAYEMHRTLARAFAPDSAAPPHRFLWRLERRADSQPSTIVLVQSEQLAEWSVLDALAGYAANIQGNKPVDLEKLVQSGGRYRFRLLGNPTVTRGGKRYGLTREEEQLAWLARQGERHGFAVLSCERSASERLQVRQGRTGNLISVHSALFEGVLQAIAPDRLRQGLVSGLGHGKALGMGLMSLALLSW
jgi:CRISPR system Cascade subunit CasE